MNEKVFRTFLAIPLPKSAISVKNMLYSTLEDSPSDIQWVKNQQLHLTVKYLGNTPESLFNKIIENVKDVTKDFSTFDLIIQKTGCFPVVERPRVLWMGVKGNTTSLNDLVVRIDKKLDNIGFPKNMDHYVPHITVARLKYPQKYTPNINVFLNSSYDPIDFTANRMQFFTSELLPTGTIYSLIQTFPLGETF